MASIAASQLGHSAPLRNYCLLPDVRGAQVSPIGRGRVPARHEIVLDVSLDAALPFGAPQAALERALAELAARCGEQGASSEPVQCTDVAIDNSPTEEIRRQITLELQCAPSSAWTTQLPRSLSPSQALLPPQHLLQLPLQEQQNLSQWPHRRHLSLQQHPAPPPMPLYQLLQEPLQQMLQQRIVFFKKHADGLSFISSASAIQCMIVMGNTRVKELAQHLWDEGFFVKPILHPTVPKEKERLRICLHAFNTEKEISDLINSIRTWEEKYSSPESVPM